MRRSLTRRGRRSLLASFLTITLCLPCAAGAQHEELGSVLDSFISEHGLNEGNFALGFRSVGGDEYLFNADKLFDTASLYKIPLNMYYYELEASGALAATDKVGGVSLADCHRLSLVKSDNELSEKMVQRMGGFRALKLKALEYCGMSESDVGAGFFDTTGFTVRMMLGILEYLYNGGDVFAGQLELMKTAQEGEYLRSGSCGLEIAQKYGAQVYNGLMNFCVAGIVYADEPFFVVIYTRGVGGAGELMGEICDLLAEFETDVQTEEETEIVSP